MNFENSQSTLSLSKKSELVLPFIGIHPECANDNDLEKINELITSKILTPICDDFLLYHKE